MFNWQVRRGWRSWIRSIMACVWFLARGEARLPKLMTLDFNAQTSSYLRSERFSHRC